MKRKLGAVLMLLGLVMLFSAGALLLHNQKESDRAGTEARTKLEQLVVRIEERRRQEEQEPTQPAPIILPGTPEELIDPEFYEMEEMQIDGNGYIGYISIPCIALELPVMSDWDDSKLQITPCRYTGTVGGKDLVIMAHNFPRHFGSIDELQAGDRVYFIDVSGNTTEYVVVGQEILPPTAVEEMTEGVFPLTLFTCTYGGANRVTVRCELPLPS